MLGLKVYTGAEASKTPSVAGMGINQGIVPRDGRGRKPGLERIGEDTGRMLKGVEGRGQEFGYPPTDLEFAGEPRQILQASVPSFYK